MGCRRAAAPLRMLLLVLAVGLSAGCSGPDPSAPAQIPASAREDGGGEAEPSQALRAGEAVPRCYLGVVVPRKQVDVVAEGEGIVEEVAVRLGDRVEAGEELARLATRALVHRLEIERAQLDSSRAGERQKTLEVDNAERELERRRALGDLLAREEEEAARFRRDTARAALDAAEAEVARVSARVAELESELELSRLRSPFAGRIGRRYVDPGTRVIAGTPIVRLLETDTLLARFAVPPEAAAELGSGSVVRVEVLEPPATLWGAVEQTAPELDTASLTVFVEARVEPPEGLAIDLPLGAESRVSTGATESTPSCRGLPAVAAW
ncbi:MAG: efflux RND transporter periplasmic adaptor subunit [Holophagales bacterium]|nr:efflux RND transporter periplasmic adaptor subunit [Holophagales bacterium]